MSKLLIFLLFFFVFAGCDFKEEDVGKKPLNSSQFAVNCELNMDAFLDILEKNIESDIRCLGETMNLFIRVVEPVRPGYISRKSLEEYIVKNRPEITPKMLKALKSVFDLNHLITGEQKEFISKKNVELIVEFAQLFNKEAAVNIWPSLNNNSPLNISLHKLNRKRLVESGKRIIQALRKIPGTRVQSIRELNLEDLLESFIGEENPEELEEAKRFLALKKVIIGGDKNTITNLQFESITEELGPILMIALDIKNVTKITSESNFILDLLVEDVSLLNGIIFKDPARIKDVLISIDELSDMISVFLTNVDLKKYEELMEEVKVMLMNGEPGNIRGKELYVLFLELQGIFSRGSEFFRLYDANRELLDSKDRVTLSSGTLIVPGEISSDVTSDFVRITNGYRFFRGKHKAASYSREYRRNPEGMFEVLFLEYAVKKVAKRFGVASTGYGGHSLELRGILGLLKMCEALLIDLDVISAGSTEKTAETVTLLGSLFQYQSDDNTLLDVNEATELVMALLTSINLSSELHGNLKALGCESDGKERVAPECFKENFFGLICRGYKNHFPLLMTSLGAGENCSELGPSSANLEFLDQSIRAARSCHINQTTNEEIWYSEGDIFTVMMALLHIETTILRWDLNENNIMDPNEVMNAYPIYSPALDGFLETMPAIVKTVKKQIFQYLIKYEKVPDAGDFGNVFDFVKFLLKFNKSAPASRKTIASVLRALSEQGTPAICEAPEFESAR